MKKVIVLGMAMFVCSMNVSAEVCIPPIQKAKAWFQTGEERGASKQAEKERQDALKALQEQKKRTEGACSVAEKSRDGFAAEFITQKNCDLEKGRLNGAAQNYNAAAQNAATKKKAYDDARAEKSKCTK